MKITLKIKLDSGKELELTEDEYQELQVKLGGAKEPYYIPYVPNYPAYQPNYPWYPGQTWISCSDIIETQ